MKPLRTMTELLLILQSCSVHQFNVTGLHGNTKDYIWAATGELSE